MEYSPAKGSCYTCNQKNKENNNTILTISGRDGLVDQMTYFNKQIASKNVTGYYLIRKGSLRTTKVTLKVIRWGQ